MMTANEIRRIICETTLENGGHLASSLGAVELAMALADVFDPMNDRIVWDVGHQAYAWKLLTGRADSFGTLRRLGGLSGFPNPAESPADAAVAGHAGVALSVAEGYAFAYAQQGVARSVVAVVGDAAMANGSSLEALNNCFSSAGKVIVVLNDNETDSSCAADAILKAQNIPCIGPVDGHDLLALKAAFAEAKSAERSVVVRVRTVKGRGFAPAEADPAKWHGVSPKSSPRRAPTWSETMGDALRRLARDDRRVCALTAAMKDGTGLSGFADEFPDRFIDVGIAEGHMVALAAGIAAGGMRPFVAVYSTFLQRAIDQVMHDVCIAKLPVVFCIDRAGVVGEDGATHHGLYDYAMLKCLPNLTICQPSSADDLGQLMQEALRREGPTAIRYPRGAVSGSVDPVSRPDAKIVIWATGDMLAKANAVADKVGAEVVHAKYLKPFDEALLRKQRADGKTIVSIENACLVGGFGETIGADLRFGWPDSFVPHGSIADLERAFSLDADSIASAVSRSMG